MPHSLGLHDNLDRLHMQPQQYSVDSDTHEQQDHHAHRKTQKPRDLDLWPRFCLPINRPIKAVACHAEIGRFWRLMKSSGFIVQLASRYRTKLQTKSAVCHGSTILSADFLGQQLNHAHKSWPTLDIPSTVEGVKLETFCD